MAAPIRRLLPCFACLLVLSVACGRRAEHVRTARSFISQWNYDRALTEIIQYRTAHDPEIQYLIGICYLRKNEYREAMNYFRASLNADSAYRDSIVKVYSSLARNAMAINDMPRALRHYQDLSNLIPESDQSNNLFAIGDLNFDQRNYLSAVEAYTRALELDSVSRRAKTARPKLIKALVNCDSFERALRLATRDYERLKVAENLLIMSEIKFNIGQRLLAVEQYDSAKVYFQSIIDQQEPKSLLDDSYFYLGEIYVKCDSIDAALNAYKKVLNLNPYQKGDIVKKAQERLNQLKGTKGK